MKQQELESKSAFQKKMSNNFYLFTRTVFAASFDTFQAGNYIHQVCDFLQDNKKTVRIGPKDHFKSTSLYAFLAWKIWKAREEGGFGCFYFSYDKSLAFYHLAKLKTLIKMNPFFSELKDYKAPAEGILKFAWEQGDYCVIKPKGLLTFKRGIHEKIILVDDPFQDPASLVDPVIVRKVNQIFKDQILDMPLQDGYLHVVMTPQTKDDFCYDANMMGRFKVLSQPVIFLRDGKDAALWPEHMNLQELYKRRQERGEKTFMKEYMCMPSVAAESFWSREAVERMMIGGLVQVPELKSDNIVSAGWDIGKFRHPAFICVFEKIDGTWFERFFEFMDGWDYSAQVEEANSVVKRFGADFAYFDATGREVEGFREKKTLDAIWQPVIFKTETKWKMANNMESLRTQNKLFFVPSSRQKNQLLVVDNSLQAMETIEGHGEPFFAAGLALLAEFEMKKLQPMRSFVIPKPRSSPFGKHVNR